MSEPSADRLALLYRVSQNFNSSLDLDQVLNLVMDEVISATRAERGFLMLRDGAGQLAFRVARGIDQRTIEEPEFQVSRSVIDRVARDGRPLLASNALDDDWLKARSSVVVLGLRSILCVPLQLKGETLGVIYVDNRLQSGIFTGNDLELLNAIAFNAAIAIDNARLFQEAQDNLKNLRLLHAISSDLTSTLDLQAVLVASLQRAQDAFDSVAASILMVDGSDLVFRVALGGSAEKVKPFRVPKDQGIAGWVVTHAQGVIVNDVQNDPRYYRAMESGTGFLAESLMAAPLIVNDRAIGVIEVFNRPGGYSPADLDLLSTIAASAAIAIENARLYQVAVDKGRMERELQVAREVQASLLPRQTPRLPGWEFAAQWRPAREVAGDFYDFIDLANGAPPAQRLGIVIADVSDKGMPAALFMALSRSIVRASAIGADSPAQCIAHANRLICADATGGMFVTLFYAALDPTRCELTYVNAGHNPPLWYRAERDELVELERTGMVLGVDEAVRFEQRALKLGAGDFVLLYTDGVTDAIDAQRREFGKAELRRVTLEQRRAPADAIVAALGQAVSRFVGSTALFDDLTLVVAKCL